MIARNKIVTAIDGSTSQTLSTQLSHNNHSTATASAMMLFSLSTDMVKAGMLIFGPKLDQHQAAAE